MFNIRIRAFFTKTGHWLVGRIMGATWEGETCSACGKIHAFGDGCSWRCPKD